MRLVPALVVVVVSSLAACGSRAATGPAWPKAAERETDGGESLAPRDKSIAAVEASASPSSDDASDDASDTEATATDDASATPEVADDTSAGEAALDMSDDEIVITGEEIVIEIDDDED